MIDRDHFILLNSADHQSSLHAHTHNSFVHQCARMIPRYPSIHLHRTLRHCHNLECLLGPILCALTSLSHARLPFSFILCPLYMCPSLSHISPRSRRPTGPDSPIERYHENNIKCPRWSAQSTVRTHCPGPVAQRRPPLDAPNLRATSIRYDVDMSNGCNL